MLKIEKPYHITKVCLSALSSWIWDLGSRLSALGSRGYRTICSLGVSPCAGNSTKTIEIFDLLPRVSCQLPLPPAIVPSSLALPNANHRRHRHAASATTMMPFNHTGRGKCHRGGDSPLSHPRRIMLRTGNPLAAARHTSPTSYIAAHCCRGTSEKKKGLCGFDASLIHLPAALSSSTRSRAINFNEGEGARSSICEPIEVQKATPASLCATLHE